ncbi:proactivator polypeptide-like 1 [Oryza brachyantha]|uniref:Pulmonary surfactant-associated protein B n=1 Tax=Oryza brachyantha TaxID=4533 RepID=J3KWP7_ORYBR|nr:proactivator polypeptide-like 1 [Oryza brachyantha]XP_006643790.1 proactivator polypeptide-like 1 [Oryza brachyantha]XP_006643791.1 proactivator polypeptide-like 1 [Oryza brachyantha]XP_015692433.1 proactivator polypeptide-like 1 [Oryza brachyantha]
MCSTGRFAFVLVLAFSVAVAESRDSFGVLAQKSFPLANKRAGLTSANGKLCQLCEQYSTEALFYLQQNETQTEILSILHHACANVGPLKQQCITLVDYYIPLFFLEVSVVQPEKFCESVHLCRKGTMLNLPTRGDICGLCHHVLVEVLIMLKDPDMQLEIVDILLKACGKADNYVQQCKKMVLEYIPLILVKSQKFLETTDVCSEIHACKTGTQASETMLLSATS